MVALSEDQAQLSPCQEWSDVIGECSGVINAMIILSFLNY